MIDVEPLMPWELGKGAEGSRERLVPLPMSAVWSQSHRSTQDTFLTSLSSLDGIRQLGFAEAGFNLSPTHARPARRTNLLESAP